MRRPGSEQYKLQGIYVVVQSDVVIMSRGTPFPREKWVPKEYNALMVRVITQMLKYLT